VDGKFTASPTQRGSGRRDRSDLDLLCALLIAALTIFLALDKLRGLVVPVGEISINHFLQSSSLVSHWKPSDHLRELCLPRFTKNIAVGNDSPYIERFRSSTSHYVENFRIVTEIPDNALNRESLMRIEGRAPLMCFWQWKREIVWQWKWQNLCCNTKLNFMRRSVAAINHQGSATKPDSVLSILISAATNIDTYIGAHLLRRPFAKTSDILSEMLSDFFHSGGRSSGFCYGTLHIMRLFDRGILQLLSGPPKCPSKHRNQEACECANSTVVSVEKGTNAGEIDYESGLLFVCGVGCIIFLCFAYAILKRL
jgi:hypothetical protein